MIMIMMMICGGRNVLEM